MIEFKRLQKSDLGLLRELNEVFAEAFEDRDAYSAKKPSDGYVSKLLAKDHVFVMVAKSHGRVVGGLVAYALEKIEQERSEIYIYDLAVAETFRRKGVARGLILELKEIGKKMGAWVLMVQADKVDEPAVQLYRSLGIQEEPFHFDILIN